MEHIFEGCPGIGDRLGVEAVAGSGPVNVPADEAGIKELPEMLGDRRLGEGQELDKASADAPLAGSEDLEDADADRMAQGLGQARCPDKGRVERFGLRLGHGRSSLYRIS
jgi:hypothetical protein